VTKLIENLPWRYELDFLECHLATIDVEGHADALIAGEKLPPKTSDTLEKVRADLVLGLQRAALYYWFGLCVDAGLKLNATQKEQSRALGLKLPPKHRPKRYEDHGFIWVMGVTWQHLGGNVGTATFTGSRNKDSAETASPFQRFCAGWLKQLDPDARPPSRNVYRRVLEAGRRQGAIKKPRAT
jgi:hypothetical protein